MMKWRSGQVELEPHSTFLGFTASQPSAGAEFSDFQLSLRWGWGHPVNCPTNRGPADCVTLQVLFSRSCSSVSTVAGDGVEFAVLFWDSSIALWCLCTELCQSRKTFQLNIDMMPAGASLSTEFLEPCPQKTAAFYLARKTPSCHCCPINLRWPSGDPVEPLFYSVGSTRTYPCRSAKLEGDNKKTILKSVPNII